MEVQQDQNPSPAASGTPLAPEHLRALSDARQRSTKVRRAAGVAAISGWTMAVFGAITVLGGLFGDPAALLLGVGLAIVAVNEIRAGAMLRQLDPRGARRLGYNQIALGAMLVVYAGWSMVATLNNPVLASMGGSTGDRQMDAVIADISRMVAFGVYGGMAALGVIAPGLTSWYYFSRGHHVRRVKAQTPPWVVEALRAAA